MSHTVLIGTASSQCEHLSLFSSSSHLVFLSLAVAPPPMSPLLLHFSQNVTQPALPSKMGPTPMPSASYASLDASREPRSEPPLPPALFHPIWLLHVGLVLLLLGLLGASFGHYHYKRKAGRRHSFLAARQQHARILLPRQSVDLRASIDNQLKSVQCRGPICEGRLQSIREDSEARDPLLGAKPTSLGKEAHFEAT